MPFKLQDLLYQFFIWAKNKFLINQNLDGDRAIEWSFVAANLPPGQGRVLDFGCGPNSYLGLITSQMGYQTTSIDLGKINWPYVHHSLKFVQSDILKSTLKPNSLDLIINCSSIEHVGLAGRYGVGQDQSDGDIKLMRQFWHALKPDALMLLTIPVGQDVIYAPWHRVYGPKRLPKLLSGYHIIKKEFWVKNREKKWIQTSEKIALNKPTRKTAYSLGCLVLQKPSS